MIVLPRPRRNRGMTRMLTASGRLDGRWSRGHSDGRLGLGRRRLRARPPAQPGLSPIRSLRPRLGCRTPSELEVGRTTVTSDCAASQAQVGCQTGSLELSWVPPDSGPP